MIAELGWQPFFDQQVSVEEAETLLIARVAAHFGNRVLFFVESNEFSVPISIIESASERPDVGYSDVAVGDWFLLDRVTHRAIRRLDRKALIARKAAGETVRPQLIAANVDTVFIVTSCNQDFNLSRLERYLALVLESQAEPIVILTKADLHDDPASLRQQAEKLHPGLVVETLDARDRNQTLVLDNWCRKGKTVALVGSSGVGKSTLANAMGDFEIETSSIREDDAKGRHTTTARSLHRLNAGGLLIDTPGMRELQLPACEVGVAELFEDVLEIANRCKFRDCQHQGDAGCAIESAVTEGDLDPRRLASYLKLQSEQARNSASLAERRERDRKQGKLYKKIISEKQNRRKG